MPRPFSRLPWLLLIAAIALSWSLGGHRLLDPDEGRNAEVAREMAQSGDYVVPHLDGLPYLDKPVFYFAAAAASMEALGPTEAAARLPALFFTLASVALVVWWARKRWGPEAGWLSGIALATMPLVFAFARETIFDSTLAFFLTAAILAFVEDRPVLAWAAIGLGGLTKGPVAILVPLLAVVPYVLLTGRSLGRVFAWRGLAVFLLIALPWFLVVTARHHEFPDYAFVRETFQRVTTKGFHRTAPFWYYIPIVLVGAFPWIVPALAQIGRPGRWRWLWEARQVNQTAQDALLLLCWLIVPLVFFSLNQSKLPHYVLPLLPAIALAAGYGLSRQGLALGARAFIPVACLLGLGLITLTVWFPAPISLTPAEKAAMPTVALALGLVLVASGLTVALAIRRDTPSLGAAAYAAIVIAIPVFGGTLLRAVGEDRSSAPVADAVAAALSQSAAAGAPAQVVGIGAFIPSLPFYLRRTIPVATATGKELTSTYIAEYADQFRTVPGSPLLTADAWRDLLARCPLPTIFIARAGDRDVRATLHARLPLLAEDGRFTAYGPCRGGRTGGR
ncbi:MAG TPA: glycosyltransferase family 39 protein [Gemmatimonadales bacterium]|nr:glycosyltransferase family 39 protein [Gemmatimonadales bacterium]